jgi:hypothetical protein
MSVQQRLALDVVQFALDLVGIVDPTGTADAISGLISLGRGKWLDAAISGVSLVPYIGDLAKTAKLPRYVRSVAEAIQLGCRDHKFAAQLKPALEKLLEALNKVPLEKLPASAQAQIRQVKTDIQGFVRRRMYNPGRHDQEFVGARGLKGSELDLSADEAYQLLNDAARCVEVPGKKQFVAVKNGKIYVYQPGQGGYHAYLSTGKEVAAKYPTAAGRVGAMLGGVNFQRLSRME